MRVAELLYKAEQVHAACVLDSWPLQLADAITDLLSESAPCGYEPPEVRPATRGVDGMLVEVPASWAGGALPDDARAMARMLLRAADEAEGQ